MRTLNNNEIDLVAGGYGKGFFADLEEAAASMVVGAAVAGAAGAIIGGKSGGLGGWGFASLGQLVGMIGGGMIGMAAGAVVAPIIGLQTTWSLAQSAIQGIINGTLK